MNYYNEIKNKIINNKIYAKVKDYSKERHKVITYFEIGRLLNEADVKYGDNNIEEYSKKLVIEVGKLLYQAGSEQNDKYVIRYCSDERIIAREYELI